MPSIIDLIRYNHGVPSPQIDCLNHGFVRLVDVMPRISYDENIVTCDHAIVQAARVSYGAGTKKVQEDRGLIRYLLRNRHTSPFEMIEVKLHCAMPLFIARQWVRHRTASLNEYSGRYSVIKDDFWLPEADDIRTQSKSNKQTSEGQIEKGDALWFLNTLDSFSSAAYDKYLVAMEKGVGREQARAILPVNVYTQWYWKIDLHNLLHFLSLRCDAHAQKEIRVFADAIKSLMEPLCPWTFEAWEDYHPHRGAMLLTRLEADAIRNALSVEGLSIPEIESSNKRENSEWGQKALSLGFKSDD